MFLIFQHEALELFAEWKPEWFHMDKEVHNDPAVMCRLSWQARRLWGHDEDDVDLGMVLNNHAALGSIFAPVGTYMRNSKDALQEFLQRRMRTGDHSIFNFGIKRI